MGRKSRAKSQRKDELQQNASQPAVVQGRLFQASIRSGPMPDADELREYDSVVPGMAQALLENYLGQTKHRQKLESWVVINGIVRAYIGQVLAGGIALFTIWRSTEAILQGRAVAGFGGIVLALGSLVAVFLKGKRTQSAELEKRAGQ